MEEQRCLGWLGAIDSIKILDADVKKGGGKEVTSTEVGVYR